MIQYKIVLLPFPFDDLTANKVRPAVCLTEYIGSHNHVVVAFMTSRTPSDLLETDIVISDDMNDFPATGLKQTSTLRLHRLMTISPQLIHRELGRIPATLLPAIRNKIAVLFSLADTHDNTVGHHDST